MSTQQAAQLKPAVQPAERSAAAPAPATRQRVGPSAGPASPRDRWTELQRGIGNQAVGRLLQRQFAQRSTPAAGRLLQRKCACGGNTSHQEEECDECRAEKLGLQPKLRIGSPDDIYEREADRIAEAVTRIGEAVMALPSIPLRIRRKCARCDEDTEALQKKAGLTNGIAREAPAMVDAVLRSPGSPLDRSSRAYFEPRFGRDFSRVRIHDDARAAASAAAVQALAYTAGQHIVFAAGAYTPRSEAGRKLLAHELTHTVQQSSQPSPGASVPALLQRAPQYFEFKSPSRPVGPFFTASMSNDRDLYFGQRTDICHSCHQLSEQDRFSSREVHHQRVTESSLLEWAATDAWGEAIIAGKSLGRKYLFSLILRRQDKELDEIWNSYREPTVAKVAPNLEEDLRHPVFIGSEAARTYWANYLDTTWSKVVADLDQRAVDWVVREIDAVLNTRQIPPGATLVTDPGAVAAIERGVGKSSVGLGRWGATASVGFEWQQKRLKAISDYGIFFEVMGHEGIYFEMSDHDFLKTDPFVGKVATDVAAGTKGIALVGKFIKGFLTALASPVTMVLDTAAKVLDMASQGISALGKWRGWYDIGYTCLSSTCRQYEACLESDTGAETCRSEVLKSAVEEATIIIPLYQQGRECLVEGDAEACGGIAALALGLVKESGERILSKAELEEAQIRSAIERPHAGDPKFEKVFEKSKLREPGAEPRGKTPARAEQPSRRGDEPAAGRKPEPGVEALPKDEVPAIDRFATRNRISPKRLRAEITQLREAAKNPANVHEPADTAYDAEMTSSVEGEPHTFDRRRGMALWCRYSPGPPACGVPIDREVNRMVDDALKENKGRRTGRGPAPRPEPPAEKLTAAEYEKTRAAAKKEFQYGDKPGQISAEVGRHKDAPAIREGEGVSGKKVQSAHVAPSSFLKRLDDYSRDNAITMLLEKGKHGSFDEYWKEWSKDQRRLGRTEVTVRELHNVMADAIDRAPITDGQKSALFTLLNEELSQEHGLTPDTKLELPYANVKALKPGPELNALKAKTAAVQKARSAQHAAAVAKEKMDVRKTIDDYEKIIKRLERSPDPNARKTAQLYRLEIEKLKKK